MREERSTTIDRASGCLAAAVVAFSMTLLAGCATGESGSEGAANDTETSASDAAGTEVSSSTEPERDSTPATSAAATTTPATSAEPAELTTPSEGTFENLVEYCREGGFGADVQTVLASYGDFEFGGETTYSSDAAPSILDSDNERLDLRAGCSVASSDRAITLSLTMTTGRPNIGTDLAAHQGGADAFLRTNGIADVADIEVGPDGLFWVSIDSSGVFWHAASAESIRVDFSAIVGASLSAEDAHSILAELTGLAPGPPYTPPERFPCGFSANADGPPFCP